MLKPSSSGINPPSAAFQHASRHVRDHPVVQSPVLRPEPPYFLDQRLRGVMGERYSSSAGILMESSSLSVKPGFFGDTSSSAFVNELNNTLGIRVRSEEDTTAPKTSFVSESNARNGAEVLRFFESTEEFGKLLDRWLDMNFGGFVIYEPIYRTWCEGVKSFMDGVKQDKMPERLERRSLTIWRNTQRPLQCHGNMSALEWARQSTGENLRWETLGLLLSSIARMATCLAPWDTIFRSGTTSTYGKMELLKKLSNLIKIVVDLSRKCGTRNELSVHLLFDAAMTESLINGDMHNEVWTSFGEVCDTVVLMGLHLEKRMDARTPFWLCELRVRFLSVVYSNDKFLSTYLGRPPHMSYRFCVLQEPQDLSDEEVCGDENTLASALARLQGGWTTTGHPHRITWMKASSKRFALREDIVEILVSPHIQDVEARVRDVRRCEEEALKAMPAFVQLDPLELLTNVRSDLSYQIPGRGGVTWRPVDVHCFLAIQRQRLHADFLLEKVLVNRRKADPTRLLSIALKLLKLILTAYEQREFLCNIRVDFTDMLAFYAIPAAGVLAMELIQPQPSLDFPRSEVLQQLSVLVPALESVRPGEGNYTLCVMGLNPIRKVLDRVLSSRPPRQDEERVEQQNSLFFGADVSSDADFLQWLGSVDFESGSWLDSGTASGFSSLEPSTSMTSVMNV
ncbi:Dynactin, isoform [Lecanosticta acicola]|uniref:Dynactin, isoform n=1 Tax=Lecanosticta acicola TaxID=111012 RepID=A0AAI8Z5R8_9PEZI|nr:Dynactin, isoform [Lecanosticta acicola]